MCGRAGSIECVCCWLGVRMAIGAAAEWPSRQDASRGSESRGVALEGQIVSVRPAIGSTAAPRRQPHARDHSRTAALLGVESVPHGNSGVQSSTQHRRAKPAHASASRSRGGDRPRKCNCISPLLPRAFTPSRAALCAPAALTLVAGGRVLCATRLAWLGLGAQRRLHRLRCDARSLIHTHCCDSTAAPAMRTQVERITVAQRDDSSSGSDRDDDDGIELTKPRTGSSVRDSSTRSLPADTDALPLFLEDLWHFLRGQLILHPDSRFVRGWQWMMLGSAMWLLLSTPWFAALDPAEGWRLRGLDLTLLLLHAIDIWIHCRTGFRQHGGAIEFDSRTVARRYLRSTAAVLDLLALAPVEFLAFVLPSHPQGDERFTQAFWFAILKSKHLLRIHTVWSSARLEHGFQTPRLRVLKLFFAWSLVAHICASMLIFVARNQPHGDSYSWITVASPATQDQSNPSNGALYITALYVSFVIMTSVGYGDTSPVTSYEQLVHCIILLVSLSFYALIFSSIAGSIQAFQVQFRKFQARVDSSVEFAAVNDLPRELRTKMDLYVRRDWQTNHGFLPELFLADLPTSVQSEVMLYIHSALVQRVPFFRTCSDAFLSSVILRMRPQVLLAGDYVFRSGDRDRSCFYISKGEVEILQSASGEVAGTGTSGAAAGHDASAGEEMCVARLAQFSAAPFFGELALLLGTTRTASVCATQPTVLQRLDAEDFWALLRAFPDEESSLREEAIVRLQADLKRLQLKQQAQSTPGALARQATFTRLPSAAPAPLPKRRTAVTAVSAAQMLIQSRITTLQTAKLGEFGEEEPPSQTTNDSSSSSSDSDDDSSSSSESESEPESNAASLHAACAPMVPPSGSVLDQTNAAAPSPPADATQPPRREDATRRSRRRRTAEEPFPVASADSSAATAAAIAAMASPTTSKRRTEPPSRRLLQRHSSADPSSSLLPLGPSEQASGENSPAKRSTLRASQRNSNNQLLALPVASAAATAAASAVGPSPRMARASSLRLDVGSSSVVDSPIVVTVATQDGWASPPPPVPTPSSKRRSGQGLPLSPTNAAAASADASAGAAAAGSEASSAVSSPAHRRRRTNASMGSKAELLAKLQASSTRELLAEGIARASAAAAAEGAAAVPVLSARPNSDASSGGEVGGNGGGAGGQHSSRRGTGTGAGIGTVTVGRQGSQHALGTVARQSTNPMMSTLSVPSAGSSADLRLPLPLHNVRRASLRVDQEDDLARLAVLRSHRDSVKRSSQGLGPPSNRSSAGGYSNRSSGRAAFSMDAVRAALNAVPASAKDGDAQATASATNQSAPRGGASSAGQVVPVDAPLTVVVMPLHPHTQRAAASGSGAGSTHSTPPISRLGSRASSAASTSQSSSTTSAPIGGSGSSGFGSAPRRRPHATAASLAVSADSQPASPTPAADPTPQPPRRLQRSSAARNLRPDIASAPSSATPAAADSPPASSSASPPRSAVGRVRSGHNSTTAASNSSPIASRRAGKPPATAFS